MDYWIPSMGPNWDVSILLPGHVERCWCHICQAWKVHIWMGNRWRCEHEENDMNGKHNG